MPVSHKSFWHVTAGKTGLNNKMNNFHVSYLVSGPRYLYASSHAFLGHLNWIHVVDTCVFNSSLWQVKNSAMGKIYLSCPAAKLIESRTNQLSTVCSSAHTHTAMIGGLIRQTKITCLDSWLCRLYHMQKLSVINSNTNTTVAAN